MEWGPGPAPVPGGAWEWGAWLCSHNKNTEVCRETKGLGSNDSGYTPGQRPGQAKGV